MSPYPQICWKDIEPHKGVEDEIAASAEKFQKRFGNSTSFRVVVSRPSGQHKDENLIMVSLDVHLGGRDFIVSHDAQDRDSHAPMEATVRHAFSLLGHQVSTHFERRRDRLSRDKNDAASAADSRKD